MAEMNVLFIN